MTRNWENHESSEGCVDGNLREHRLSLVGKSGGVGSLACASVISVMMSHCYRSEDKGCGNDRFIGDLRGCCEVVLS